MVGDNKFIKHQLMLIDLMLMTEENKEERRRLHKMADSYYEHLAYLSYTNKDIYEQ